ncbi:arylsulfatase [Lacihabitans sp. LS3-19]|uniref:arylsulfatase n=1 Tax=Lacihabitans sp. LS3-19 TaxID=2487335 RepID=UPI0020CD33C0|nr:arylsulfatase [Lacihabitans sp. LS3-19]MCP9768328.1 arylsulfatase [Lacihabitans sp. LS3-19]
MYLRLILFLLPYFIFAQKSEKPNIVVIMVDDMGFSDIGCYGGEIPTPNIDKLAKNGLRFKQFYNTGRCCPTRASLLTGQYPHKVGIGLMAEDPEKPDAMHWGTHGYQGFLNRNCVTLAEVLKTNGYHTYMTGKWHVGMNEKEKWPLQRGFDHYYGILAGATSYLKPQGGRGLWLDNTKMAAPEDPNYYTTDAFTDYGLKFIKEQKDENPFFLYLAYNAPHWPLQAKAEDIEKFKNLYAVGWDEIRKNRLGRQIEMGLIDKNWGFSERDSRVRAWKNLSVAEQDAVAYRMAVYAAQVYAVDYNVGKVLDYLETSGKLDNTMIIFLADNGACAENYDELGSKDASLINDPDFSGAVSYGIGWANASNTPFFEYKVKPYEGGIATPMIVHYPKHIKNTGKFTNEIGHLIDLMPTLVEVSGAKYPLTFHGESSIYPMAGKSLLPILNGGKPNKREYLFWEHQDYCAVRKGDYKAIKKIKDIEWQLFDLKNDRTERNNIASENGNLVKEMEAKWHEWALENNVFPKRME